MTSIEIKTKTKELGATISGIGTIESFIDAPKGFGPKDLFPKTQSIIAFAKQIPKGGLNIHSTIPYTVIEETILSEVHQIACNLMMHLERCGYEAIIVPSEPYEYWDTETKTGKGLLSLKHLAYKCGLGVFGKNHLLYNPEFGSMIKLGAILTNAHLEPDKILEIEMCKSNCNSCISNCPVNAISEAEVNQMKCRAHSCKKTKKGETIYTCNNCRKICPNVNGII